ncbi:MAG: hypothetical protein IJ087_15830 [Eggerthellaceae bacterium]|nr:hypothetical protein [Eggerthellaceae bacterium]
MMGRKLVAVAMAVVLGVSLCPALAMAAPLEAGQVAAGQSLGAQASTQTVYVISSVTYPDASKKSGQAKIAYKYNDSGLLLSNSRKSSELAYNGVNLASIVDGGVSYTVKSKSGRVKTVSELSSSDYKSKYTFTYNSDKKLIRRVQTTYTKWAGGKRTNKFNKQNVYTTDYTVENGLPTGAVTTFELVGGYRSNYAPVAYKYDGKGNVKLIKTGNSKVAIKNTYEDGRLVTQTFGGVTYTYKYKKVQVTPSAAKVVSAQQWSIVNGNMNGAFGLLHMGISG